jgi:hypothetical protein
MLGTVKHSTVVLRVICLSHPSLAHKLLRLMRCLCLNTLLNSSTNSSHPSGLSKTCSFLPGALPGYSQLNTLSLSGHHQVFSPHVLLIVCFPNQTVSSKRAEAMCMLFLLDLMLGHARHWYHSTMAV